MYDSAKLWGIVRHIFTGVGGGLVATGYLDNDTAVGVMANLESIIGGVMFIGGVAASVISKVKE